MTLNFVEKVMTIGGTDNEVPTLQFYKKGFVIGGGSVEPTWQDVILSGNTALTLVNSKADGLNYLKLFGGTEQRNLPSEYTQVEYLESTGTQYINTGVIGITDSEFELDAQQAEILSGFPTLLGAYDAPSNGYNVVFGYGSGGKFYTQCGTGGSGYTTFLTQDTNRHIFRLTTGVTSDVLFEIDDQSVSGTYNLADANLSLYLCARHREDGTSTVSFTKQKVYYLKIWKSGNLIRNFVPCKNASNVVGMYDLVSGQFFENQGTGTFTAGAVVTPSPDTPLDIVSNNGVLKVYRNLFDRNDPLTTINAYVGLSSVGDLANIISSNNDRCFIIKTKPNTKYTIQKLGGEVPYNRFRVSESDSFPTTGQRVTKLYDDIATTRGLRTATVTTGNNGNYIIVYGLNGNTRTELPTFLDNFVVCEGDTINVGQIYTDGTTETVNVHSKNLFNPTKVLFGYYRDRTTGDKTQSAQNFMSSDDGYIPCLPNTTYTFVGTNKTNGTYSKYNAIYFFDSAKNYLGASPYKVSQPTTGTTPNNCYYLQIRSNPLDTSSVGIQDAFAQFNWQLEQGSTATAYEPYTVLGSATAEMLLAIGLYKDIQSVLDGNVTRNVGVLVLTGTEEWSTTTLTNCYSLSNQPLGNGTMPNRRVICTHFGSSDTLPAADARQGLALIGNTGGTTPTYTVGFGVTTQFSTISEWNAYLTNQYANGTPVIIVYPLATATIETVTPQPLTTQAGTNIVEITQASIDDLELEVSYKAGVSVTITEVQNAQLDNNVEVTING